MSTHAVNESAACHSDPEGMLIINGGERSPARSEYIILSRDMGPVYLSEHLIGRLESASSTGRRLRQWGLVKMIQQHNVLVSSQRQNVADIATYLMAAVSIDEHDTARAPEFAPVATNRFAQALNERLNRNTHCAKHDM